MARGGGFAAAAAAAAAISVAIALPGLRPAPDAAPAVPADAAPADGAGPAKGPEVARCVMQLAASRRTCAQGGTPSNRGVMADRGVGEWVARPSTRRPAGCCWQPAGAPAQEGSEERAGPHLQVPLLPAAAAAAAPQGTVRVQQPTSGLGSRSRDTRAASTTPACSCCSPSSACGCPSADRPRSCAQAAGLVHRMGTSAASAAACGGAGCLPKVWGGVGGGRECVLLHTPVSAWRSAWGEGADVCGRRACQAATLKASMDGERASATSNAAAGQVTGSYMEQHTRQVAHLARLAPRHEEQSEAEHRPGLGQRALLRVVVMW